MHFRIKALQICQFYHLATDQAFDTAALSLRLREMEVTPVMRRLDARLSR